MSTEMSTEIAPQGYPQENKAPVPKGNPKNMMPFSMIQKEASPPCVYACFFIHFFSVIGQQPSRYGTH
jgi:hypothetical protein